MHLLNNWILLAALAGLASNAFNFFNRYVLKEKDDPTMYAWFQEIVRFVIFAFIALFDWRIIINPHSLIILFFLGATEGIGIYFYMKMHYYSHLSISTILSRTRIIWIAIVAYFLIGENLKNFEYLGILILFGGLSVVVAPRKMFVDKGAIYANLAAFMIALNTVIIKISLPYGSIAVLNAVMLIPAIIILPLLVKDFRKKITKLHKTNLPIKSLATLLSVVSLYLLFMALKFGDSSKVMAIYQGMMVFSVLAGIIFLKERENIGRKLIGTFVTLIGVLLLTAI